jgi:hypothetical protein
MQIESLPSADFLFAPRQEVQKSALAAFVGFAALQLLEFGVFVLPAKLTGCGLSFFHECAFQPGLRYKGG